MDITEVSFIHHVGIVLLVIWLLSFFNSCHPLVYLFSFIYLYMVHENVSPRFKRKVRFEEIRQANEKMVFSDSGSVRWLNHLIKRIWPLCIENIVSQRMLLPIMPWIIQKYKPWTVREGMVPTLFLGKSPPIITELRIRRQSTSDDHLVLEAGLNFRTSDDMNAILAVKLAKKLCFGTSAKLHLTGLHVEGKVLLGIKFLPKWPFLGRLSVRFVEPHYFQLNLKSIFAHGHDVSDILRIAGWMNKLLKVAFKETVVEPNMLVVDVEKLVSSQTEAWFSVDAKEEPVGYALVEVVEGSDMRPSDMKGLLDPYIKGELGAYRFRTKTLTKTLSPKWYEEFKIPVVSWNSPNLLQIRVHDKDNLIDDTTSDCCVKINEFRDGKRHDIWLSLEDVNMGRLHIAVKVVEGEDVLEQNCDDNESHSELMKEDDSVKFPSKSNKLATECCEPIDVKGLSKNVIWVQRPGPDLAPLWEPRKEENTVQKDSESVSSSARGSEQLTSDWSNTNESLKSNKIKSRNPMKKGFIRFGSLFHRYK
uniref:C2 domain-containing protein At1g53590-like n=1 Tax=Erigeron canadensis TaxID=72917 RepID=UPI001CB9330A|nr:C2 domain-containing protein At1g53590-like [Erigeron canadensis]